jgi:hypothetical protein
MADVASSAENNGTAINKVADLFVRLGQRGDILAIILMLETRPQRTCERILAISGRAQTASTATLRKIYTRAGKLRAGRLFGSRRRDHAARTRARINEPSLSLES